MGEDEVDDEDEVERELDLEPLVVAPEEAGLTLLSFLAERLPDVPTSALRRAVEQGEVLLGGRRTGPGQTLAPGDEVLVDEAGLERIEPAPLEGFRVLYEDAHVLAVEKPAGVVVEAERGQDERPFKAALLHHLRGRSEPLPRPRIVHRLDRDTSGVLLVATSRSGLADLTRQLEGRTIEKEYLALVLGAPRDGQGTIELAVEDHHLPPAERTAAGVPARTRWEVVERFASHALVRAWPETGRQHQIRQHLAAVGHPLAVDPQYGGGQRLLLSALKGKGFRPKKGEEERPLLDRLSLHAHRITFTAPASDQRISVEAPLPKDLEVALKQLRRWDVPKRAQGRPRRES